MLDRIGVTEKSPVLQHERRPDIDWLRVCSVILLVPFHAALIFNPADPTAIVYVKKQSQDMILVIFQQFLNLWQMPLLFLLAGMSAWYALEKRNSKEFLNERLRRLGVPLVFGTLALIPPMLYLYIIEVQSNPPSFIAFYLSFFTRDPGDLSGYNGGFTPAHLWFIIYLLLFSAILIPIFARLRRENHLKSRQSGLILKERPAFILLFPALALSIMDALPSIGGKNMFFYCTYFIFGFVIATDTKTQDIITRLTPVALALGIGTFIAGLVIFPDSTPLLDWTAPWILRGINFNMSRWSWTFAIVGLGRRYAMKDSKILRYASNAAYPFYIIHFLMLSIISFFVIQLPLDATSMYAIIVPATILATFTAYDLLVRRNKVGRFLFGMKANVLATDQHAYSEGSK
jgi:glucans biosynthesis protein C